MSTEPRAGLSRHQVKTMREDIKKLDVMHLGRWGLESLIDKLEESTPNVFTFEDFKALHEAYDLILEAFLELEAKLSNSELAHCRKCGCTELLCGHNKRD